MVVNFIVPAMDQMDLSNIFEFDWAKCKKQKNKQKQTNIKA